MQSLQYICAPFGPFVQGLGRQVFILETGVRFPYGLLQEIPAQETAAGIFLTVILASPVNADTVFYQVVSSSSVLRIMSSDC